MKALFVIVPILLVGGAFGAAKMGVIQVPGISPKKVEAKKQEQGQEQTQEPVQEQEQAQDQEQTPVQDPTSQSPAAAESNEPPTDTEAGAKALAKYWDAIPTNKLIPITETYSEKDLAQVLLFMQKPKVAEILGAIDADRAAKLSRELQRLASIVKEEPEGGA